MFPVAHPRVRMAPDPPYPPVAAAPGPSLSPRKRAERGFAGVPAADLIAEDLACRRGERLIFSGLSFRLPPGGAVLLTRANGSAKTSRLRLLATLLAPAGGRLAWGEAAIEDDIAAHRARLHYVGHQDGIK